MAPMPPSARADDTVALYGSTGVGVFENRMPAENRKKKWKYFLLTSCKEYYNKY